MKIDLYNHVMPMPYLDMMKQHLKDQGILKRMSGLRMLWDIEARVRMLDEKFPDVQQVLTLSLPSPELVGGPELAPELARIANDGMAGMTAKWPKKFPAFVASLPMNNVPAALEEMDRAIAKLGARGVQICTSVNGRALDEPEFFPVFERATRKHDVPIWMHPARPATRATPTGTNWFPDKYLPAIKSASDTYGKPLVDVYDFHWYPEEYDANSTRITSMSGTTLTDAQVQLIVQSPRNLWDPTYNDGSSGNSNPWIFNELGGSPIQILPRLQAKVAAEFPGMKGLSMTEYEGGGWNHIAGTIAQADMLGIFGSQGLFAANLWPPSGTYDYVLAGFRVFRGFDGANANFGDTSLSATSSNVQNVVVYASLDSTTVGREVFVAINRSTSPQVTAINGLALSGNATVYQITASSAQGQSPVHPVKVGQMGASGTSLTVTLPALSVSTIEVK